MSHMIWKMLTTIKNGSMVNKKSVVFPYKKFCKEVLFVLYKEGYICGYRILPADFKKIEIFLKYDNGKPTISKLVVVSKPGKRVFSSSYSLWKQRISLQTLIFSSPKGVFCDKDLRQKGLGGELFCIIQ